MPHDTVQPVLLATTPSLGVRLWVEPARSGETGATLRHDMVCLQVANEGGRGNPVRLVLLPVRLESTTRVVPAFELDELSVCELHPESSLCMLHFRKAATTLPTPGSLRYNGAEWCKMTRGEPWVLVLAIFPNLEVVQPDVPREADVQAAIRAFFNKPSQSAAWLRRGLVYLATADVPPPPLPDPAVAQAAVGAGAQADAGAAAAAQDAPPAGRATFTFALASCHYPAGLVDGTPQRFGSDRTTLAGPADAAMLRLAARLEESDDKLRPSLLLLTGDQIYADATAGLFDPRAGGTPQVRSSIRQAEDWLRIPYQNWLGSVGAQSVLGRVSSRMMLDDHEIDDNWEPLPPGADPTRALQVDRLMQAGSQAYQRYQRDLFQAQLLTQLWHTHLHRGIRFFLADTRTERHPRDARQDAMLPCIIGSNQAAELQDWISKDPAVPAFITSPSMLLPRRRRSTTSPRAALHSDAWDGYPGSLHRLLVHIWKTGRSNLVFLSGDEHLSSVVRATITRCDQPDRAVALHSVHSSGLYCPYPFANAVPALFALPDDWTFADPDQPGPDYRCVVEACSPWVPGDGFALLRLAPPASADGPGDWQLRVCFDRAQESVELPRPLVLSPGPGQIQLPV
jgi:hypothetical protein